MQFSIPATTNASAEAENANNYPDIRLFTVGQGTSSKTPLNDLKTIEQKWAVANATSVSGGGGFGYFSSVCWFFGKRIYDSLKASGSTTPLGLVSNNWGGTPVEHWADPAAFARCNRTDTDSTLYNAMINPYVVGPMALKGMTWYQCVVFCFVFVLLALRLCASFPATSCCCVPPISRVPRPSPLLLALTGARPTLAALQAHPPTHACSPP